MDTREVFISYSRYDLEVVKEIKSVIEDLCGVKCWMDLKNIESGSSQFTQEIIDGIDNCNVFLFMLSEKSQESEFALLELNYAKDEGKQVVLVNINDCKLIKAFKFLYGLTDRIAWTNDAQREKLLRDITRWIQPTIEAKKEDDPELSKHSEVFLKIKTDLNCVFYLDGEETVKLRAGELSKVPLSEGEYELRFVSEENAKDFVILDYFEMPRHDKRYDVKLLPVREKRLEQERVAEEARQKAEQERLEQERIVAEQKAKAEAAKKAKEEAKRKAEEEKKIKAREMAARKAKEAEEQERLERERKEREYQEEENKVCRIVPEGLIFNVKGVEFKMVNVEGGSFWMGADDGKYTRTVKGFLGIKKKENYLNTKARNYDPDAKGDEYPVHNVTVHSFYLGETVVTQALWKAVMMNNPSKFKGENLPVEQMSWNGCQVFIRKLNQLTGKHFRLPSEAEWEYAARGGKKRLGYKYSGSEILDVVAWYDGNSGGKTHAVKTRSPNELGIFDMEGNVWECCQDWYGNYGSDSQSNPLGPSKGTGRVVRGGSYADGARDCRVSNRRCIDLDDRLNTCGFRLGLFL